MKTIKNLFKLVVRVIVEVYNYIRYKDYVHKKYVKNYVWKLYVKNSVRIEEPKSNFKLIDYTTNMPVEMTPSVFSEEPEQESTYVLILKKQLGAYNPKEHPRLCFKCHRVNIKIYDIFYEMTTSLFYDGYSVEEIAKILVKQWKSNVVQWYCCDCYRDKLKKNSVEVV